MNKKTDIIMTVLAIIIILFISWIDLTPSGKSFVNKWFYSVQKADDTTKYQTLKKVEDTCRAMITNYEADKLIYKQYKNSNSEEKRSWAEQAKIRANKTASSYNNYILQNSFIWKDNVPRDIKRNLEFVE